VTKDFKIAIVAALEREVWPLVKDWPSRSRAYDGRSYKLFEKAPVAVVCGGIGAEAARRAAEAIIGLYQPALVVSAGFAGGLDPALRTGDMLNPRHVIDARDGSRTDAGAGEGVLVTFEGIADAEQKAKLADAFGAHAVDMEAAAVARSAEAHGLKFVACKVVSDVHDSRLPPIMRFVGRDGRFHPLPFVLHVAVRPWLWAGVVRLASNSTLAAKTLCEALGTPGFGAVSLQPTAGGSGLSGNMRAAEPLSFRG
jgi:adenosylhomocysteine nucleosidase